MRRLSQLSLVALMSLSLGCQGRSETAVTGPPALTRTLSGQVVPVGDLTGTSPASITVSAHGQIATTDAAGNFVFMTLSSQNVPLSFSRADGISAQTSVSGSASAVVVELSRTRAVLRSTGQSKREIEGLIVEVSDASITVNDARTGAPVTASIVPATVIRKGNRTLTAADLEADDRVHVKATVNADGSLTAFEIMLQHEADEGDDSGDDGSDGGQVKELEGLITEVSDASITVHNASTNRDETAAITADTVIRKGNQRLTPADLEAGDRVHVKTTGPADALIAREILLQK
jgi:hypothetical protein